jgi:transcriptional regulator with XRE-family HTH domain
MPTLTHELRAVEQAHDLLGLTYAEVARAIKADESTVHRWRSGDSTPSPIFLDRLDALGELLAELRRTVKDQATARYWLDRKVPALQGRTPREVLLVGRIERLTGLLASFNAGNAL